MNKLNILLENLGIQNQVNDLKNATLDKVVIKKDNQYIAYICADNIISFNDYKSLAESKSNFPFPIEFIFKYKNNNLSLNDFKNYTQYLFNKLDNSQIVHLNQDYLNYSDGQITITFENEIQYLDYKPLASQIEDVYKQIGLDAKVVINYEIANDDLTVDDIVDVVDVKTLDIKPIPSTTQASGFKPYDKPTYNSRYNNRNLSFVEMNLCDITNNTVENNVIIKGYIFKTDSKSIKNGEILTLYITDYTDSIKINIKDFGNNEKKKADINLYRKGKVWIKARGSLVYDNYEKEMVLEYKEIETIKEPNIREDTSENKRVELHLHTNMSAMDGINPIEDYIKRAKKWGHKAIAITDHENVQGFPDAQAAAKANDLKMIYGVELNMVDPNLDIVLNERDLSIEHATYVSFDLETTGLSVIHDGITEIGAVKIINGQVVDRLQTFINPERVISDLITQKTNITNEMVKDAPTFKEYADKLLEFFGDAVLVAHNARFDIGFLNQKFKEIGYKKISNPIIDTLPLARALMKPMNSYTLGKICKVFRVDYDNESAHRADYDADVLSSVFISMLHQIMQGKYYQENTEEIKAYYNLLDLNKLIPTDNFKYVYRYHTTAIALNKTGLKNIFKIVSESNTTYMHKGTRIPKDRLEHYHEGIIYGTSCYKSDVFEAALNLSDEQLISYMEFYDYVEIQPISDYMHLVYQGKLKSKDDLIVSLKRIITTAKKLNKIIVATGDVHFLDPHDKIYRDVYIVNPTIGIGHRPHPLFTRDNTTNLEQYPCQYFRTTNEMFEEYPYLTEEEKYEYIVTNTNIIADMVEEIKPVHSKLYPPTIKDADENLKKICYERAHKMYGQNLPAVVSKRLEKELGNIIKHGFGVIYYIAHLLVKKSNDDGYLVGSRGSVGSSFVATMAGISEVNPLPPHYRCPNCGYSEFLDDGVVMNGFDLEDKKCPSCNSDLIGDGHNIPFETFLGFNADKVPDIDLNFSGEYQAKAHAFTREMFGEDNVFKAGTISTVADKTAYGYARAFMELTGRENNCRSAEIERIANGCQGVKRTTGQHPGGIIAIPSDMDVYDFTPVQYPADDINAAWRTTHFDFHKIHDNVLKFDILGHVDPTVIRALQDITGVDPHSIPTNDKKVISLFTSSEALGCDLSFINCRTGSLGLPEFGTNFVRGMLEKTRPKNFYELVVISGLSHGTDVYLNNAETLIESGEHSLSDVIGCRDDIMTYLISYGLPNKDAFDIMECVRKGKAPKVFPEKKYEELMLSHGVPQWYIDSCKKIKYMFPKAHAAAYVLSAIRVAWWKLYYPREYYTVYFSTRCDFFDLDNMIKGKESVLNRRKKILEAREKHLASNKDLGLLDVFDITLEMLERGYHLSPISLELSQATKFILDPNDPKGIIPPFAALDQLGEAAANTVIEARNIQKFLSKEDVIKRTKLNNSHIQLLSKMGVFNDMQEQNQLSFF